MIDNKTFYETHPTNVNIPDSIQKLGNETFSYSTVNYIIFDFG